VKGERPKKNLGNWRIVISIPSKQRIALATPQITHEHVFGEFLLDQGFPRDIANRLALTALCSQGRCKMFSREKNKIAMRILFL